MQNNLKKLYRSKTDRVISGICGGMGVYFDMDSVIFRIIFIFLALSGVGVILYIILIFVIPLEGKNVQLNSDNFKDCIKESASDIKNDAHDFAQKIKSNESWFGERRNIFAFIIILIGIIALLKQFFPVPWFGFHMMGPVMIIVIGLLIISKK